MSKNPTVNNIKVLFHKMTLAACEYFDIVCTASINPRTCIGKYISNRMRTIPGEVIIADYSEGTSEFRSTSLTNRIAPDTSTGTPPIRSLQKTESQFLLANG
ncbi:hypothetical protein T265_11204 [Opisthorchis viverrini]|uniref:Uncharacterized protein n=1 Tax=Opisthorchis viverrini TaxID=6198 RepID=A0A074YZK2_OPIVI|nr:hypothetical protein T265_11204 [Opisthorchis viverrini]KER20186.1 hypothetical protein T265_11204 [Opisthorchis viverrini]